MAGAANATGAQIAKGLDGQIGRWRNLAPIDDQGVQLAGAQLQHLLRNRAAQNAHPQLAIVAGHMLEQGRHQHPARAGAQAYAQHAAFIGLR